MKIIVTGSLGHISKPLTQELVQRAHTVTVISSNPGKLKDIEALGAKAAIGSITDANFLTSAFTGADVVYCMEPPIDFFDVNADTQAHWLNIANSYVQAIRQSGVKQVVHLSSIGAHTNQGNGMLAAHHEVENILKQLPGDVIIKTLRPVGFYYNMFAFIPAIKNTGTIIQNYGGDEKEPWVSPLDIATVIAEEIEEPFTERTIRYVASNEVSPNEIATILGNAIGKPDLKWVVISDEQFLNGLMAVGMNPNAAKGLMEMNAGRRSGTLYEDYFRNKPTLGKTKLTHFAKEFAVVYHQQTSSS